MKWYCIKKYMPPACECSSLFLRIETKNKVIKYDVGYFSLRNSKYVLNFHDECENEITHFAIPGPIELEY